MTYFERRGPRIKNYQSCFYNGRIYHSKKEAGAAQELDLRLKAKDIKAWEPQVKMSLDVNGHHITNYFVDFKITHNDDSIEYLEIKGFVTEIFRFKRLLFEATFLHDNPGVKYTIER